MFYSYGLKITIIGKVSYLFFKADFHGYSSIYWFKVNVT
jgi:hypothetical protein